MKKALVFLIVAISAMQSSEAAEPRTAKQLVTHYTNGFAQGKADDLMSLFWKDGTPQFILDFAMEDLQEEMKARKIVSVSIEDVPAAEKEENLKGYPYQGKRIVANLEPMKKMVAKVEPKTGGDSALQSIDVLMGKVGKTYYFVLSKFKEE